MTTTQNPTDPATWPTQVWLPGQTAAHPGPVDMTMMYVMHHAFRRDLATLAAAAAVTPASDRRAWVALADRWDAVLGGAAHAPHRRGPGSVATAARGRHPGGGRGARGHGGRARRHRPDAGGVRGRLRPAPPSARTTTPAPRSPSGWRPRATSSGEHLRHEETEAIEIIQRRLSGADWHEIEEQNFKHEVSPRLLLKLVPWVAEGVPAEVRDVVFSAPGGRVEPGALAC